MLNAYFSLFELGLIFTWVALGVMVSFRFGDGSFTLGACISVLLLNEQVSWPLALMASAFLGALAGGVTATLNLRFKIMDLLSGILVMMALYSINLRLISGPNLTLDKSITATLIEPHLLGLLGLAMMVLTLGILFFQTQMGLALRAVGANPVAAKQYGISTTFYTYFGLMLSNGLVAVGGGLFALTQGFADVSMGAGTVIMSLAAIILGEFLITRKTIFSMMLICVTGAITYRLLIGFVLEFQQLGLQASDFNLLTAGLMVVLLFFRHKKGGDNVRAC